jgi:hypothetical protein
LSAVGRDAERRRETTMTLPKQDRRSFLHHAGGLAVAVLSPWERLAGAAPATRPKVAAVYTEFRFRSHAHDLLENFLEPCLFNGRWHAPAIEVVSFYADQFPAKDMARAVARDYKLPIHGTIAEALRLGGKELAVDAVLIIGEHGDYPVNAKGQREYPRKRFFDEAVAVIRASGRSVPVFNDKHLSYRWDWAKEMYDTAVSLQVPFMAGSSVPLAQRLPPLELPPGGRVAEAVAIHGGGFESYDFHGLEVVQSLVESRAGGETGVERVQFLGGDALWRAAEDGLWSPELADAAMAAELGPKQPTLRELVRRKPFDAPAPFGTLVHYRDGLRGLVLKVGEKATRWNFACRLAGEREARATAFRTGPWGNRNLFMALAHAIQQHFVERRAPYPVERTLLTTGVLAAAADSRFQGGRALETPHLKLTYQPRDFRAMREMGESWKVLTADTPEPAGIKAGGGRP